jgi:hypothetical protein
MRPLPMLPFQAAEPAGQSESGRPDRWDAGRLLNWLAVRFNSVKMFDVRNMRVAVSALKPTQLCKTLWHPRFLSS